jgi:hypothetical protein
VDKLNKVLFLRKDNEMGTKVKQSKSDRLNWRVTELLEERPYPCKYYVDPPEYWLCDYNNDSVLPRYDFARNLKYAWKLVEMMKDDIWLYYGSVDKRWIIKFVDTFHTEYSCKTICKVICRAFIAWKEAQNEHN